MKRPATRRSYAARIEKVVEHLASHLDQPLTLEHLAGIGHFSPFHFHRIYRGLMGETVAGTLRRMRLHRAAAELVHGRRTLESIARRCGYGSSAAFNRAFAHSYGMPPGEFRRRRGGPVEPPPCPAPSDPEDSRMYDAKDVKIETLPPRDVAALRHQGDYLEIGTAFEKLFAWAAGRGLDPARQRSFGIYYDDPESKPAADLVSDACIEIQPGMELDGGPRHITIAGGRHAVFIHTGPYAELERAYRWLFGEWLPASGEEAADAPVVEEYLNDPRSLPPTEWQTAICVPLK
ncbi:AraC family transcriptional regulator [Marilutibacter alkalisoli]|uniref:AraC family transcriptional regulator n=1 Tax=Marilutibacter alkalisoli TaxID=2591633 RepID=A0A514BT52_9GAMM|nr:AraC family transcriptional regulator [Lysobacter alkalisoli]QDH70578.1 AraC family transcriptional regulator [Lysobacter alkalisoli]